MQVLFVNMPFGSIRPALGVSLLKGHLARMGVRSRVLYLNLDYAERHGKEFFHTVADLSPPDALIGEWIFSPCLFEDLGERKPDFLEMLAARFRPWLRQDQARFFEELARARADAPAFLEECLRAVHWESYDLVGFTTSFAQNVPSLALARRLKARFKHLPIAFGGANCEGAMGLQIHRSFPFVDFVFSGEADLSFPALVERLRRGQGPHGIPGVVSRKDGGSHFTSLDPERVRDLDALPFPEYDDYFGRESAASSADGPAYVLMETSRGCWWGEKQHCTFCGLNGSSMAFRAKSPARALDEIFTLTERHRTHRVEMVDNILDMGYFKTLLPELKRRGVAFDIFYETKANLRRDQVALLRAAGVRTIQPGIESFSTNVLRLMRKGTTGLANVQLLKWCREFGLKCNWNLTYGFPGETARDYEEMVELLAGLHHLRPPDGCGPIRVDRFSPFFVSPDAFGLSHVRHDRSYSYVYDLEEDALTNLAYYFEHDYADGRDLSDYSVALHEAVAAWEADAGQSRLTYADDGAALTIEDRRPGAADATLRLAGVARALYLFCDQYRSWSELVKEADARGWSEPDLKEFLGRLGHRRLLVSVDGRHLALAVSAAGAASVVDVGTRPSAVSLDASEREAVRAKIEAWGDALTPRERALLAELLGGAAGDGEPATEPLAPASPERP
jgi:ribosomal peptide maturation radical SAM protein 1